MLVSRRKNAKCVQMEQQVNLKFLVKLGKTATEVHTMLKEVYIYRVPKFLCGLKSLRRDVKQPKTIRALDDPQGQKRTIH